jgi:hypothetical protein
MAKKSYCSIILSTLVCLGSIGVGITLIVLGTYQKDYYDRKYLHTLMDVINYTSKNEECFNKFQQYPFSGYVIMKYNVIFNKTNVFFYTNISHICGTSYKDAIRKAENDYPLGSIISAWYFTDDPTIWIRYKPRGEFYLIGGICTGIIFAFSLMILGVCICKKIKKRKRREARLRSSIHYGSESTE